MKAQETTLQQLIQGEKQFQVPLYQRTYSWHKSQWETLWHDILEQAENLKQGDPGATHFMGSVVLAPGVVQAAGVQKWLVVDGQQRLTTLMLIMVAIRDHLATTEPRHRDRIDELYLTNKWHSGLDHYRLLPTQADRDAFFKCVSAAAGAGGTDAIGAAYRFFRAALVDADDVTDTDDIDRIERVVRTRLALVEITCELNDNVHRIFESLNNTGLGLSQADLLRNYLFMLLPTRGETVYQNTWLPMQEMLGAKNLELLAWLDLILRGDDRVLQNEAYEAQKRRLEPLSADEGSIVAEIEELARKAHLLKRLVAPETEEDPPLRAAFQRLDDWRALTAYPVLLRLLDLRDQGAATSEQLVKAVSYVESFLVRRMLLNVPTNNLNRIFNALTQELEPGVDAPATVRMSLSAPRRRWPRDSELREAVRSRPFYWQGRPHQRVAVLRRLEKSFGSGEPVDYATAALSIEHVLPQTLSPNWRNQLSQDLTDEADVRELHGLLVHTLGNLTMTAYNSSLGNLPFAEKLDLLKKSAFRMNQAIAQETRWGKTQIHARAEDLADRACRIWPAPLPGIADLDEGRDWGLLRKALAAMPSGTWTTYSDVAELIGSHPVPVGSRLASVPEPNAYRVLQRGGAVSGVFRWLDESDERDPLEVLRSEGVRINEKGLADPAQRLTAEDLADLLGLRELPRPAPIAALPVEATTLPAAFREQLQQQQGAATVHGANLLLNHWRELGGTLEFGVAAQTSCFLIFRAPTEHDPNRRWWPLTVYPSGSVEIAYQHLSQRPPWDDEALRDELRRRLNRVPGIAIDPTRLSLRPSFALPVVGDLHAREQLFAALEWFMVRTVHAVQVGATAVA